MSAASLRGAGSMPSHGGHAPLHHGRCRSIVVQRRLPAGAKFGFLGDDRGLRAGRKRCGCERDGKQPYEFPCTRGRDQRCFKLSTACSDVDARSTGAANGRHVAIPRSRPSPSRKPTRGNGGTESGRKRGRTRSGTVSTAQFGSSVVIVSQMRIATGRVGCKAVIRETLRRRIARLTAADHRYVRKSRRPTPCPRCRSAPRVAALASARWSRAGCGHARSPPPAPSPRSSVRPQGPGRARRY